MAQLVELPMYYFTEQEYKEHEIETKYGKLSPRNLMILIGQFGRQLHPDFWLDRLAKKIDQDQDVKYIIIDDIRFENEITFFRERYQTFLVRLQPYGEWDFDSKDETETSLDRYYNFDYIFFPKFGELDYVADKIVFLLKHADVAQSVEAIGLEPMQCGFESHRPYQLNIMNS